MSITYDPMTGEPIETPDAPENTVSDAAESVANTVAEETAAVVNEAATDASAYANNVAGETVTGYGGYNAQPNPAGPQPDVPRFDPMTGAPLGGGSQGTVPKPKKKIDPKIFIFGGVGLVLVAGLIILLLSSGGFSRRGKVESAVIKTMKVDSRLYKDTKNLVNILKGRNYSVTVSADVGRMGSGSGAVVVNGKDKQVSANLDIQGVPEISVLAGIDSKTVKAEIPEISDYLFVYDYTAEKSGYITKQMDDEDIEALDAACKAIYDYSGGSDEYTEKILKLTRKYERKLKWDRADAKTFKVNDKKVKCKGYTTTIDKDFVLDYWDEFTDIALEEFEDVDDDLKKITGDSLEESLKEARDELKGMKDTDISFYIYRGALAAVEVDAGKNGEFAVKFKGGDFRAQNIEIDADGEEVLKIKGSKSKDKETYTLTAGHGDLEIEYNTKKGTLTLGMGNEEYEFDLKSSSGSFVFSADDMDIDGMDVDFTVDINNSGKIQKYTNSEVFSLGDADEDDFEDLTDSVDMSLINKLSMFF
ncbi:MAG: hypothetical protein K6F53_10795 [Lachnospiraceae bacterium]|nr:hypothetical protein [Lachnospiraceae bacterium]